MTMILSQYDTSHLGLQCGYNSYKLCVTSFCYRHIHRILDPNTIFRFTGLSNNAQLEMVACAKMRTMSNVTIGIQPEDGERIMREYSPNVTLAQALTDVYPDTDLENAVLIYMHREVYIHMAYLQNILETHRYRDTRYTICMVS